MDNNFQSYGYGGQRSGNPQPGSQGQTFARNPSSPRGFSIGSLASLVPSSTMSKYGIAIGAVIGAIVAYMVMKKLGAYR
ncbi:MAG: hypothetical protein WC455_27430 [Dehalococcoidia bacterium]|jgi:hypothetical protein